MVSNSVSKVDRFVLALLAVSLAANVFLAILVFRAPLAPSAPQRPTLAVGTAIGQITGRDVEGTATKIEFLAEGRPTLIHAFTATCPWCKVNLPNLRTLIRSKTASMRIVGLVLEKEPETVRKYLETYNLEMPEIVIPDNKTMSALRLGGVPQTIMLSADGKVQKVWNGAYSGAVADEVAAFFKIELPGLAQNPDAPEVKAGRNQ